MKFKVNDKVVITAKEDELIAGIHNFDTDEALIHNFGYKVNYCRFWDDELKGTIKKIGINNFFLIEDSEVIGKIYVFNNTYGEMKKC